MIIPNSFHLSLSLCSLYASPRNYASERICIYQTSHSNNSPDYTSTIAPPSHRSYFVPCGNGCIRHNLRTTVDLCSMSFLHLSFAARRRLFSCKCRPVRSHRASTPVLSLCAFLWIRLLLYSFLLLINSSITCFVLQFQLLNCFENFIYLYFSSLCRPSSVAGISCAV